MKTLKIPEATIIRLSMYSRYLSQVEERGVQMISSGEIAEGVGVSPAHVRKDLAYFGEFGTRGVGYNVDELQHHILNILRLNREWRVVIVGAGHLGSALAMYRGFQERGFHLVGIFDSDPAKIGQTYDDITVQPIDELDRTVKEKQVGIGIITVPATVAQEVADILVSAGVDALLNFAPCVLNLPPRIELRNVDLSVNLEVLTFNLGSRGKL
ncbi:redox-sensing transcriptional repressor Rex [Heliobacterium gestii]|uniref:Redox-sensing transcriptional repressor Rex n=1 Tax=Heliomicrobium gestii TaxID=2699 RepID=A0A845L7Q4_HELGE|nr:redox-sensing transcriptional repressor Rex [Heliomicrobium gestii]MBM7866829.1 redox-sensing transcriptional repressor [Heliomicrobium gestii]MZP42258.1 redox-sensing transcriptional repressor Rex [Heliomicrobium gestii]